MQRFQSHRAKPMITTHSTPQQTDMVVASDATEKGACVREWGVKRVVIGCGNGMNLVVWSL